MPPAGTFESEQRKGDAVGHDSPEMPPDAAAYSESEIDARLSTLRRLTDRLTAQAVELCNTQLGSKLPGELIGQILSAKRWRTFAAIASEYPLIEALVSVLEKSATETLAARVKKAAEKARKQPSTNLEDAVQEEARASAASAVIEESELANATTRFREQTENEEKGAERMFADCDRIEAAAIASLRARRSELIRGIQRAWELMSKEQRSVFPGSFGTFGRGAVDQALNSVARFDNQEERDRLVAAVADIIATEPTYDTRVAKLHELTIPRALFDPRPVLPKGFGSEDPIVSAWKSLGTAFERLQQDREAVEEARMKIAEFNARLHEAWQSRLGEVPTSLERLPPLRIGGFEVPRVQLRVPSRFLIP